MPPGAPVAGYYFQAINKDAPHPAAARLWQEFLYSDEGQNLFARRRCAAGARRRMVTAGTIDKAAYGALPAIEGPVIVPTRDQNEAATKYLADNWAKAIG